LIIQFASLGFRVQTSDIRATISALRRAPAQGIATIVAVMLFLMECEAGVMICVMLAFAISGLVIGDRATVPRP
jgi:hypothetical protein